jgi:hypothetical protein
MTGAHTSRMSYIYIVHNWNVVNFYTSATRAQHSISILRDRAKLRKPTLTHNELQDNIWLEIVQEGQAWGKGIRKDHAITQDVQFPVELSLCKKCAAYIAR